MPRCSVHQLALGRLAAFQLAHRLEYQRPDRAAFEILICEHLVDAL